MNLKGFHIFFITCSTAMAVFLALWSYQGYQRTGDPTHLWLGIVAVAMIITLLFYGRWFLQKMRKMPKPIVGLTVMSVVMTQLVSSPVWACAVCFKDPNSPLVKGAQSGVLFLGIIIYGLLMGIVGVAYTWYRRSKTLSL